MNDDEEYLDIKLTGSEFLDGLRDDLLKYLENPNDPSVTHGKKLLNKMYGQLVANLFASKKIQAKEISDTIIVKQKVIRFLRKNGLQVVITYTDAILGEAHDFRKHGRREFSMIFYAMYFEHSINGIIKDQCELKGFDEKIVNEIIRTTSIAAKFTWLLEVLELTKFKEKYYKTISRVAERRNSIIHYKWQNKFRRDEIIDVRKEQSENEKMFNELDAAVRYMKKYESLVKYKKTKSLISKRHVV